MKEDMNKIIDSLNKDYDDDFTEEETLYDLELVRQYEKERREGRSKSRPVEEFFKELGF